ncbi:MAG TPA: hypothetical protein VGC17_01285 [Lactovum miscens]|uniref:hypothetical protein n=1 Tax=Lactovum miscens TaxID=190387 RepID=UPI002EDAEE15
MRTLLVGDLHLKMSLILPMVEEKVTELSCQRVVLLGDYMDLFWAINENLLEFGLQVAYWLDDFLISHAGFCFDEEPKEWYFQIITSDQIIDLVGIGSLTPS